MSISLRQYNDDNDYYYGNIGRAPSRRRAAQYNDDMVHILIYPEAHGRRVRLAATETTDIRRQSRAQSLHTTATHDSLNESLAYKVPTLTIIMYTVLLRLMLLRHNFHVATPIPCYVYVAVSTKASRLPSPEDRSALDIGCRRLCKSL